MRMAHPNGDGDLSFEALTFGEDSSSHYSEGSTGGSLSALSSPNPSASITSPTASPGAPAAAPEKPDTILVLKNLPFSLKQDQLQEILMAMNTTAPQSINLHFDNMGVFRGMAFIKYRLLDDAIKVYEALNGYDVGGRKVRVEYKRKNKGQQPADVPQEWIEEEDLRKLWEQVKDFSNNPNVNEISFTPNLSSNQRKHIHTMAEKLKLTHYSNGDGEQRYICIKKPPPGQSPVISSSAPNQQNAFSLPIPSSSAPNGGAIDIKGRRPRRDSDTNGRHPHGASPVNGNSNGERGMSGSIDKYEYRPRGASYKKEVASSAPADINMDWREQQGTPTSATFLLPLAQSPSIGGVTIAPTRQPKGPDGSKGFSDLYRNARKHASVLSFAETPAVQEISVVV